MRSTPLFFVLGAVLAIPAWAPAQELQLELGGRVEQLRLDGDFEFSCTCDPEEDPGCDSDPDFCREGTLDAPHDGYLVGGFLGVHGRTQTFSIGFRLGATLGTFQAEDATPGAEDALLVHVTGEVPIEARFELPGTEVFVQAAPRLGFLNLEQDGATAESPDTITFGVLLMAGVRFGGGVTVGAAAGRVQHPYMSGWAVEASVRTRRPDSVPPPPRFDAPGPAAPDAPDPIAPGVPEPIVPGVPEPVAPEPVAPEPVAPPT